MSQIVLNNLGKSYGNVSIIKGISLSIHEGEFIVLVGARPGVGNPPCCA